MSSSHAEYHPISLTFPCDFKWSVTQSKAARAKLLPSAVEVKFQSGGPVNGALSATIPCHTPLHSPRTSAVRVHSIIGCKYYLEIDIHKANRMIIGKQGSRRSPATIKSVLMLPRLSAFIFSVCQIQLTSGYQV